MINIITFMQPISQIAGPANIPIPDIPSLGHGIMIAQTIPQIVPIIPPNNIASTNNAFLSFGSGTIS